MKSHTRILLPHEVSEIIGEVGPCLALLSPASHPAPPNRYNLHLIPCTIEDANKAALVAKGELLTRKKPTKL